jgi:hypothetical protein
MITDNTTSRKPESQMNLYTLITKEFCYVKKIVESQVNYIPLHSLNEKRIKNTITKR